MYRRYLKGILVGVLALALLCPMLALARGGGGGGGHSGGFGGGRSSGGWGGGSSSSGWGGSSSSGWGGSRSSSGSSGWGGGSSSSSSGWGSSRSTGTRTTSPADRALADRARSQGTSYTNRADAVSSFKTRYGSQYTSHYASEPSARPSYIPQSYTVSGRSYTVIYNRGYGGYGYYGPTGAWMFYDAMADAAMCNMLMRQQGYYYGGGYGYGYGPPMHSYFGDIIGILFIVLFIVIIVAVIRSRRGVVVTETSYGFPGDSVTVVEETYYEPTPAYSAPPPPTYGSVHTPHAAAGPSNAQASPLLDKWNHVTPGAVITLSDAQAYQDSIDEGRGPVARDYTVIEVRTIEEEHGYGVWKLFRLQEVKQIIWFMAKISEGQEQMRCFFELAESDFKPGNRREQVNNGNLWLFQEPGDPSHFAYQDLRFTTEIEGPPEDGKPAPLYTIKGQDALNGAMWTVLQDGSKRGPVFVTIVEYEAPDGTTSNPELLLLEINGVGIAPGEHDNPDGGIITLMQGNNLLDSEVVVMPVAGQ